MRRFGLILLMVFVLGGCNTDGADYRQNVLSKCTNLAEETKQYARANYLKLFYEINPEKFEATYQKVSDFDHRAHRAMINTYLKAISRLEVEDQKAKQLINASTKMAHFVNNFVDTKYKIAASHISKSQNNPKSDSFFVEINEIVKFDYNVKGFDKSKDTYKGLLEDYDKALASYLKQSI